MGFGSATPPEAHLASRQLLQALTHRLPALSKPAILDAASASLCARGPTVPLLERARCGWSA